MALPAESKLILLGFTNRYQEEKAFARSIAMQQVPGYVLIGLSKETTSGTTAATGVTTWLSP